MAEYTPTIHVCGRGSITLTSYPSSERIGVVQIGENAVMDAWELVEFVRETGLLADHDRQVEIAVIEKLLDETTDLIECSGDTRWRGRLREQAQNRREGENNE